LVGDEPGHREPDQSMRGINVSCLDREADCAPRHPKAACCCNSPCRPV